VAQSIGLRILTDKLLLDEIYSSLNLDAQSPEMPQLPFRQSNRYLFFEDTGERKIATHYFYPPLSHSGVDATASCNNACLWGKVTKDRSRLQKLKHD
jgi:hypothetical protein